MRDGMIKVQNDDQIQKIKTKFDEEFGRGEVGTVFTDHIHGGPFMRLKGF